jgi:hypothetical protein
MLALLIDAVPLFALLAAMFAALLLQELLLDGKLCW